MPDTPTLDRAVIATLSLLGADTPGFMNEIVQDFAAAVAKHTVRMRAAAVTDDRDALSLAAHSLRGSCGIIGARRMAALSATLEEHALAISREDAAAVVDRLEREYVAVRSALGAALAGEGVLPSA
jgi:HPt (histidine-containing phosphotransfer) domain-containing protein